MKKKLQYLTFAFFVVKNNTALCLDKVKLCPCGKK